MIPSEAIYFIFIIFVVFMGILLGLLLANADIKSRDKQNLKNGTIYASPGKIYCQTCGKETDNQGKFCQWCGGNIQ